MTKKTDDALIKVCKLAGRAVLETPRKGSYFAYVQRDLLNEIEDALTEAGYDMRQARVKYNAAVKTDRQAHRVKRDADTVAKFPPPGTRAKVSLYSSAKDRKLDKGTVIAHDKKDMVMMKWDEGEPSLISAYHLEHLPESDDV